MKIALIGSTQYKEKFDEHAKKLKDEGHEVAIPAFDSHPEFDELGICAYNLYIIEQADEIHVIWDRRSTGTIFDMGMCFALRKPIKLVYMEPKSFEGLFTKYEKLSNDARDAKESGEPLKSDD